jgi:hypothetical protein
VLLHWSAHEHHGAERGRASNTKPWQHAQAQADRRESGEGVLTGGKWWHLGMAATPAARALATGEEETVALGSGAESSGDLRKEEATLDLDVAT